MLTKEVFITYQIQIREWREIQKHFIFVMADFESACGCATKFSNFWTVLHSRIIIHYCCSLSMPNIPVCKHMPLQFYLLLTNKPLVHKDRVRP